MKSEGYKIKIITIIMAIILIIIGIVGYMLYQNYQEKERKRLQDGHAKQYLMLLINDKYLSSYIEPEYDEKYWEEFIKDKTTSDGIRYVNQFMEETYSDSPYTTITAEELDKNYDEIYEQWSGMEDYLKRNTRGRGYLPFGDLVIMAKVEGRRRDTMNLLGYSELTQNYDYYTTYTEYFLEQEDLETFLEQLNQYMKENYPEISYEDITMKRLEETEYDVCDQLWEVTEKLADQGVDFSQIVELIHEEIDIDGEGESE
ncbi:hypothetical protein [Clostridium sp. Marseille-P3244]|uniref:hypothetical protein n=1 Tax=Clostridium sp. Marseille-P3244 TaxID=1871020 RepID=UPI000930C637|nr:hypothetical protein [Clostridium sp. Marseille-P3244]